MTEEELRPGVVLLISRAASVQFTQPFAFRLIRHHVYGSTPTGCVWIDGYQLSPAGDAVERRSLFVQLDGLEILRPPQTRAAARARPSRAAGRRNRPPTAPATNPRKRPASEPTTGRKR